MESIFTNLLGDPDVRAVVVNTSDVTERVRAEEALRLRDRVIQAVTAGVVITDLGGPGDPIVYANAGFERLTGYAAAEVVGRNCRLLQGKDTDPMAVAAVREAVRAERACSVELLNYRKDGTPCWNALTISPLRDDAWRLIHFVGVQTDVTQWRRLEEQYRQAQKLEAVGQLSGGIAHDFNNLLTAINGFSELLLQQMPAGAPRRGLVEEARRAGERSADLTRQLLAFSRRQVVLDFNEAVADPGNLGDFRCVDHSLFICFTYFPASLYFPRRPAPARRVAHERAVDGHPQPLRLSSPAAGRGADAHTGYHPRARPRRHQPASGRRGTANAP